MARRRKRSRRSMKRSSGKMVGTSWKVKATGKGLSSERL